MTTLSLEERLAALELEMQALKGQVESLSARPPTRNWIQQVGGSMGDFPEFEEIRRNMREAREAELAEFDKRL